MPPLLFLHRIDIFKGMMLWLGVHGWKAVFKIGLLIF